MNEQSTESERLLLVDDNPTNLQVLYQTLERLGHKLLVAKNGQDALKIARRAHPALVLLDIMMPDVDGFEVCQELKGDPETSDIAIIFLSALDHPEDKIKGLTLGAVDYISKPFQSEEVIARVDTHLTLQRLKRQLAERNRQLSAANQHILEAVVEGIYGLDRAGNITFANPSACRLTGYREDELVGQSIHKLHLYARWDGTPRHFIETPIYATLQQGQITRGDQDVFWRKSGDHFPVAWTCAPILRDGQIQGAVLAFQDITERKQQERALHEALAEVNELKDRLEAENVYLQEVVRNEGGFHGIVGESPMLRAVLKQIEQVAPTDTSVLILGESGTGKEALARAIHELSPRRDRTLIKVNCGAITPTLIESELFGHEKGAFTGAHRQRQGHFELADGGTIFLDEVGELPLDAQVKLLRVLQEQELTRVGSEAPIKVDVRVIAATNREPASMVEAGTLRMDLYYRLNVFPLNIPPLRDRKQDIPLLVAKFLGDQSAKLAKPLQQVSDAGMELLMQYDWPGNIRELQNVIERAAILATDPIVEIDVGLVQSFGVDAPGINRATPIEPKEEQMTSLAEHEALYIRRVLRETNWIIAGRGGAAEILDLPASTLRSRMKKLGIVRPS